MIAGCVLHLWRLLGALLDGNRLVHFGGTCLVHYLMVVVVVVVVMMMMMMMMMTTSIFCEKKTRASSEEATYARGLVLLK